MKYGKKESKIGKTKRNIVAPVDAAVNAVAAACRHRRRQPLTRSAYCRCLWLFVHFIAFFLVRVFFFFGFSHYISFCALWFRILNALPLGKLIIVNLPSPRCTHKFKIRDVNSCDDQVNAFADEWWRRRRMRRHTDKRWRPRTNQVRFGVLSIVQGPCVSAFQRCSSNNIAREL